MKNTTLGYIEYDGKFLMLLRDVNKNDGSLGKWLGIGGKLEKKENNEDLYLTDASINFHLQNGFEITGRHVRSGLKFGRWYNIVWMEKVIHDSFDAPEDFIPFSDLPNE